MADETDCSKLTLEERCSHKAWKARLHGYTEAANLFGQAESDKSPVFNQLAGLIPKMISDTNAVVQEKGLEAALLFVQNSAVAGKTVKDVMSVLVSKCIGAPKPRTKELAIQISMMYIEIEKHDSVLEELLKGLGQKNPKTVAGCVSALCLCLKEFGAKVIDVKMLVSKVPTLLEDRDKGVRDETKNLTVELYRWIGDAIKPKLTCLKPLQQSELETEFEKVREERPIPTRFLRSQQVQQQKLHEGHDVSENLSKHVEAESPLDKFELMDPINVLEKLPTDFYTNMDSKKWQERKDSLENLDRTLEYPKFEKGDYSDLLRALVKVVTKDSNVVVVAVAIKCICKLAQGLKKQFQTYAGFTLLPLLEKFKEKKPTIVQPLREAVDAVYLSLSLDLIQDDAVTTLENKNPSVKGETCLFLSRCFSKASPNMINKKLLKAYATVLLKALNESDPFVRDSASEALGVMMKVVGEKALFPFLNGLDNIRLSKIKEFCDKNKDVTSAVLPCKILTEEIKISSDKRPNSASCKIINASKPATTESSMARVVEKIEAEVVAYAEFPKNIYDGLSDNSWKTRLQTVENVMSAVKEDPRKYGMESLLKIVTIKPGLKDTSFQVFKVKLEFLKYIVDNYSVSTPHAEGLIPDLVDKLGDAKNGALVNEVLTSLAEAINLKYVVEGVLKLSLIHKNPKVQQESLLWTSNAIKEFGFVIDPKFLIDSIKKSLGATNVSVRESAISLCATVHSYMGSRLLLLFSQEKPVLVSLIVAEIEKHSEEKPPDPIRFSKDNVCEDGIEGHADVHEKLLDLIPRVDFSSKVSEQHLRELSDKNWKVRSDALTKISSLLTEAKCIKPTLGELPVVLIQKLSDSNAKIVLTAIDICKNLAVSMGPACKTHFRTFLRGFLTALGDSKPAVRSAALTCIRTWGNEAGYKEFFDGEVIHDVLKTGSPTLRSELWNLLAEILPTLKKKSIPKEEITIFVPQLYANLEDRNADVRKAAQGAVVSIMTYLGYACMLKETERLNPGSMKIVTGILEKVRPVNLETKQDVVKPKKEANTTVDVKKDTKVRNVTTPKTNVKKEEPETPQIMQINNLKQQRIIDEQRMKTLKWNFTTPRQEFVDALKDQMATAKFSKSLITNMFHLDFKYHLKAIESLNEELSNLDSVISNLDLILKWMTLRFFDTNPSVLLKGLEYVNNMFSRLIDHEYVLCDSEAHSFIPYLVIKLGDSKDVVRDRVRSILKQLATAYSPGKLFSVVMDGLKSKNSRQRAECLDELGHLIETCGITVCQPSPTTALKEIAKQIADRDNSVRSSALNTIVKAWYVEGDKIHKMIGHLSEKDATLLEERLRRAAKNRPPSAQQNPKPCGSLGEKLQKQDTPPKHEEHVDTPVKTDETVEAKKTSSEDNALTTIKQRKILVENQNPLDSILLLIQDLGCSNLNTASQAASKLRLILETPEGSVLEVYTNPLLNALTNQLKYLNSYSYKEHGNILRQTYKILLKVIDDIFLTKSVMSNLVSTDNLQGLINELLYAIIENTTSSFEDGGYSAILVIFLSRIIENTNRTNVICAVVRLLSGVMSESPNNLKKVEISSKCLLKVISVLKKGISSGDIDIYTDKVLFECHVFFQTYPQDSWKNRPSNMPLKAIKTLLLTLVQWKEKNIFSHLSLIESPCSSELCLYLKKLIRTHPSLCKNVPTVRLTQAMSEHLSDVFMKISNEKTAKEGLLEFYNFKKENPQIDLSPFLTPTSRYFREYVENGLRQIDKELSGKADISSDTSIVAASNSDEIDDSDLAQYYMEKLRMHNKRLGYPPPEFPDYVTK